MRPILFEIPLPDWMPWDTLPVRGYGAMLALGFLLAILMAAWRARRESENPDHMYNMGMLALVGGILGARVMDVMAHSADYPGWVRGLNVFEGLDWTYAAIGLAVGAVLSLVELLPGSRGRGRRRWIAAGVWGAAAAVVAGRAGFILAARRAAEAKGLTGVLLPYHGFVEAMKITSGGLTVLGGLILATAMVVPYILWMRYRWGVNPLKICDIVAPSLALGLAFGRMGCLLNGCCFGAPGDLPWCHTWPAHSLPHAHYMAQGFKAMPPIHPAQVYAIINALLLLAVLHLAGRWKRRHGVLLGAFFGLYGISRFLLEMIRAGEPTTSLGGLTVWQVTSLVMAAAAGVYLLILPKLPMSDLLWNPPLRNGPSATKKPRP
jgi:phosphatidylglycerol:prolipoprotein diacylglycerol transferase